MLIILLTLIWTNSLKPPDLRDMPRFSLEFAYEWIPFWMTSQNFFFLILIALVEPVFFFLKLLKHYTLYVLLPVIKCKW